MPQSIKCIHCGAVLKSQTAIPAGKKIKCPKCAKPFVVEPEEEEEEDEPEAEDSGADEDAAEESEEEATPKAKKAAKPAADDEEDADDEEEVDDEEVEKPKKKGKKGADAPKKGNTMLIGIIAGVLLLCCCCGGGGPGVWYLGGFGGKEKIADADKTGGKDKDGKKTEDTKPAFTLTALAMTKEVLDDEKTATAKYQGRMVEVTGEIWVVNDKSKFTLKGAKKDAKDLLGVSIICEVLPKEQETANLSKDQKVKVVGKVVRIAFGTAVQLSDCSVTALDAPKK